MILIIHFKEFVTLGSYLVSIEVELVVKLANNSNTSFEFLSENGTSINSLMSSCRDPG